MRADGYSVSLRSGNCRAHRVGIARMEAGCDIGGRHELEKFIVLSSALAEIGVEIDAEIHGA